MPGFCRICGNPAGSSLSAHKDFVIFWEKYLSLIRGQVKRIFPGSNFFCFIFRENPQEFFTRRYNFFVSGEISSELYNFRDIRGKIT
jgi:hypothetical protein